MFPWDILRDLSCCCLWRQSPRTKAHLSQNAFLSGRHKLLTHNVPVACWSGPTYPNATAGAGPKYGQYGSPCGFTLACGATGCLFDVVADPSEYTDLAKVPAFAPTLQAMQTELAAVATHTVIATI